MKARKGRASPLARRLAKKWLRAAKAPKMKIPAITVSVERTWHSSVSGRAWHYHRVHLTVSWTLKRRREVLVVLAHELAHSVTAYEHYQLNAPNELHHGARWIWWFWRICPRYLWEEAVSDRFRWDTGGLKHDPSYRPE